MKNLQSENVAALTKASIRPKMSLEIQGHPLNTNSSERESQRTAKSKAHLRQVLV